MVCFPRSDGLPEIYLENNISYQAKSPVLSFWISVCENALPDRECSGSAAMIGSFMDLFYGLNCLFRVLYIDLPDLPDLSEAPEHAYHFISRLFKL